MKLSIRAVCSADIGYLKQLMIAFHNEIEVAYPAVDEDEVDKHLLAILSNISNTDYIQLIALDGKKPTGYFLGYIAVHPYGKPAKVGVAQEMYVVPEKRMALVGVKLVAEATRLGLEQGVEGFEAVGIYGTTAKRWERFGFTPYLVYGHMSKEQAIAITGVGVQNGKSRTVS